ncbi:MAG: hypothetical protein WAN87_10405 [Thermoplasmata archaeon]
MKAQTRPAAPVFDLSSESSNVARVDRTVRAFTAAFVVVFLAYWLGEILPLFFQSPGQNGVCFSGSLTCPDGTLPQYYLTLAILTGVVFSLVIWFLLLFAFSAMTGPIRLTIEPEGLVFDFRSGRTIRRKWPTRWRQLPISDSRQAERGAWPVPGRMALGGFSPKAGLTAEAIDGILSAARALGLRVETRSAGPLSDRGKWKGWLLHTIRPADQNRQRTSFGRTRN